MQIAPGAGDMGAIAGRRWAWTFAFAAVCLGLAARCGSPAWAQAHRSEPAPASPPTTTLTGDWGGLRSYLDNNGVTFTFNTVSQGLYIRNGLFPRFPIYNFSIARDLLMGRLQGPQFRHIRLDTCT